MLADKVAIVTGATSGIGRATASLFAVNGANVVAVGRNETELSRLQNEQQKAAGQMWPHAADVTQTSQVEDVVSAAGKLYELPSR